LFPIRTMKPTTLSEEEETQIADEIGRFEYDPLGFVKYAYDWGEGELAGKPGPRKWQTEFLERVGKQLQEKKTSPNRIIQEAVASGHGIGKSALLGMLICWAMSTKEDTRGIITAGTEPQLKTKTWPEIGKWFRLAINAHWFTVEATSIFSNQEGHKDSWRFDRVTWNKARTEAFAGLHNEGKRIVVVFDEASQIDDVIWEVTDGALTDSNTDILYCVFGNPTRNSGAFRRCFGSDRALWSQGNPLQIDSREVEGVNKEFLDKFVAFHGENSDRVRVRVRGLFPNASSLQFIASDIVYNAQRIEPRSNIDDPLLMSLDIARGGDDNCVFRFRRGLDARTIPPVVIPGEQVRDSMRLVSKAVELLEQYKPDAFFFDGTGVGGPVGDRIRQLGYNVIEIQFGAASTDPRYGNMRAFMYAKGREALQGGLAIDKSPVLETDLTNIEYFHKGPEDKLYLEAKDDMKERGLPSPDEADALMMLFAYPVMAGSGRSLSHPEKARSDWDPYAD